MNGVLLDDAAIDVARLTGIGWHWGRVHQRGPLHPMINLLELDWWDRWRVALAMIGFHAFADLNAQLHVESAS